LIIDLHTHTRPGSDDSFLHPVDLIQKAKKSGLDGICLTEHDWFWDHDEISRLSQEHGFLILPGAEINTEEGHILIFGVNEYIYGMHRTEKLRSIVDEAGGAMILSHPYRLHLRINEDIQEALDRCSQRPFFEYIDIMEVYNGRGSIHQNNFSLELCRLLKRKGTGGSDAHSFDDVPSCATYFEKNITNLEELIAELRAGRFRAVDIRHNNEMAGL